MRINEISGGSMQGWKQTRCISARRPRTMQKSDWADFVAATACGPTEATGSCQSDRRDTHLDNRPQDRRRVVHAERAGFPSSTAGALSPCSTRIKRQSSSDWRWPSRNTDRASRVPAPRSGSGWSQGLRCNTASPSNSRTRRCKTPSTRNNSLRILFNSAPRGCIPSKPGSERGNRGLDLHRRSGCTPAPLMSPAGRSGTTIGRTSEGVSTSWNRQANVGGKLTIALLRAPTEPTVFQGIDSRGEATRDHRTGCSSPADWHIG